MRALRYRLLSFLFITLLPAGGAQAGVRFALGDEVDPGQHFLVTTYILHSNIIQGSSSHDVDSAFLRAGEARTLYRPQFFVPLLYTGAHARFYHPAYLADTLGSDRLPLTVLDLGAFHPRSWASILDATPDPAERLYSELHSRINWHVREYVSDYLPAFDRAHIEEDVDGHLQLFRQFADRVGDIDDALSQVKAWLHLDRARRIVLHDLIDHRNSAERLFDLVMDDADRARLRAFADQACMATRKLHTQ